MRKPKPQHAAILARDAALNAQAAGEAHREALSSLFFWRPSFSESINKSNQLTALHRLRGFIDRKTPILETNAPDKQAESPFRSISPALAFIKFSWPPDLKDDVADLMRRYFDAGYFALKDQPIVISWAEPEQEFFEGHHLVEAAFGRSCVHGIETLLDLGATLDGVPSNTRVHSDTYHRTRTIEAGDAIALVNFYFRPPEPIYPRLEAAALAARAVLMGREIASVTNAVGAGATSGPNRLEEEVAEGAEIQGGSERVVTRRRGL